MDFQIVMELSAVATIIGVIVSYFTFHKTSKLSYITQERKEWRADIRKIVDELEVCPFSKKKRVLTKLKTRINTYGKLTEDVGKDSHIWKQIEIIPFHIIIALHNTISPGKHTFTIGLFGP